MVQDIARAFRKEFTSENPLPTFIIGGGGGGGNNAATEITLQQVRDAIKAQINIASTIFTDNSGAFYIRRDLVNESTGAITVTFTDPVGNAATPGAGLRPLATADKDVLTDFYDILTSGTGYSVGDLLARVAILDANSTPSATFIWLNLTTGTILSSAPTSSNIERANENIGARQVGNWIIAVSALPVAFGSGGSNATTQRTVTASDSPEIAKLNSIDTKIPQPGTNTSANSSPFTIASDDAIATAIRDRLPPTSTNITPIATDGTSGDKNILTPTSGKSLRISSLYFTSATATPITLKAASTAISGAMNLSSHAADYSSPIALATGQSFVINIGSAVAINGYVIWWEV